MEARLKDDILLEASQYVSSNYHLRLSVIPRTK